MRKDKHLQTVVKAIEWTGKNEEEVLKFIKGDRIDNIWFKKVKIRTPKGIIFADIGDFIVKEINGECYPYKPEIFKKTYGPL